MQKWWINCLNENLPPENGSGSTWQIYFCCECDEVCFLQTDSRWELNDYGRSPICPLCKSGTVIWIGERSYDPPKSLCFYYECNEEGCLDGGLKIATLTELTTFHDLGCCPNCESFLF